MSNDIYLSGKENIRYIQELLTGSEDKDPYYCEKIALRYAFLALKTHRNKVLIKRVAGEELLHIPKIVTGILDSVNIDYAIGIDEATNLVYIKTLPKKVN